MAAGRELPELTDSELEVKKALWRGGARSAREVHDSTTRTTLDRMVDKGLVGAAQGRNPSRSWRPERSVSVPVGTASRV